MHDALIVETVSGSVRGRRAGGALAFLGIPYAAPPFRAEPAPGTAAGVPVDGGA